MNFSKMRIANDRKLNEDGRIRLNNVTMCIFYLRTQLKKKKKTDEFTSTSGIKILSRLPLISDQN